jgi:hypothetical protein
LSEPAVKIVTLSSPTVDVDDVKPPPTVIVKLLEYLNITIPEPPAPEAPF